MTPDHAFAGTRTPVAQVGRPSTTVGAIGWDGAATSWACEPWQDPPHPCVPLYEQIHYRVQPPLLPL
jgi:hypothetical protein